MNKKSQRLAQSGAVKAIKDKLGILIALIVMCAALTIASPYFFVPKNLTNILQQISTNAIIAFGMTYVILLGGIDLSVGAVVAISGISALKLMINFSWPFALALLTGIALGVLIGFINGFFIAKVKMPPFIVTLATMNMARGLSKVMTSGKPIYAQDERLMAIGNAKVFGGFPVQALYMLIIFVILLIVLNYTKYGRHLYATGGNPEAARYSGINTDRVTWIAYVISGCAAGITGIMISARLYSALPTMGEGAEMDAIAAVVLGGTMMSGGAGTLGGTLIGALIIGVMNNGLNLLGVNSYWQDVCKGGIILLAIFIDLVQDKRAAARQ